MKLFKTKYSLISAMLFATALPEKNSIVFLAGIKVIP